MTGNHSSADMVSRPETIKMHYHKWISKTAKKIVKMEPFWGEREKPSTSDLTLFRGYQECLLFNIFQKIIENEEEIPLEKMQQFYTLLIYRSADLRFYYNK